MSALEEIKAAIVDGDIYGAGDKTTQAVEQGVSAADVLNEAALPAIREVGDLWNRGRYFLPEVVMSSEAFNEVTARLRPYLTGDERPSLGRVIMGTVSGDLHDLGKNIVIALLEGEGFQVTDLGVDVAVERFVEQVEELRPDILGLGAYMSTTMRAIPEVIEALDKQGLRSGVRIMVGGIPVTPKFAEEAGADGYGEDAFEALSKAKALVKGGV